jgi:hypothetical protein
VSAVDLVGTDRVLRTFYAALSGAPPGRRWHQFRALFEPGSWMRSAGGSEFPIEQFIQQARDAERPRTVIEIDRAIRVGGALAFIASAYASSWEDWCYAASLRVDVRWLVPLAAGNFSLHRCFGPGARGEQVVLRRNVHRRQDRRQFDGACMAGGPRGGGHAGEPRQVLALKSR